MTPSRAGARQTLFRLGVDDVYLGGLDVELFGQQLHDHRLRAVAPETSARTPWRCRRRAPGRRRSLSRSTVPPLRAASAAPRARIQSRSTPEPCPVLPRSCAVVEVPVGDKVRELLWLDEVLAPELDRVHSSSLATRSTMRVEVLDVLDRLADPPHLGALVANLGNEVLSSCPSLS